MKKQFLIASALLFSAIPLYSCSSESKSSVLSSETTAIVSEAVSEAETTAEQVTAPQQEVGYEGMEAVYADSLKNGEYDITVDSSSSMFKITACKLTVENGEMTAKMTMSGSGYEYLFMGTGEEAERASESSFIPAEEAGEVVEFTVPVDALDKEIDCAAFSKRKEQWYDRKLVFRADSLPVEALGEGAMSTVQSLGLEDGEYTVEVELEGGSGKASVQSPAKLTVSEGNATAEIIWSSNKYDYMIVNEEKLLPVSTDEYSVFEIPIIGFDYRIPLSADTTAMSTPHEIKYTLYFDSQSITK